MMAVHLITDSSSVFLFDKQTKTEQEVFSYKLYEHPTDK